jgi:hypothetical protein
MTTPGVAERELASSMLKEFVGAARYGMATKCLCQNLALSPASLLKKTNFSQGID